MPSTLKYGITYPSGSVAPNVPIAMQTQAESVDAALTALNIEKMAKGLVYETKATAGSGGFTALTVVSNIPSFTFKAGRRYQIVWDGHHLSSVAADTVEMQIATCSTAEAAGSVANLTVRRKKYYPIVKANTYEADFTSAPITFGTDTTVQIKFLAVRNAGTGTISIPASADATTLYQIFDLGAQTVLP